MNQQSNVIGGIGPDFACGWIVHVESLELDGYFAILSLDVQIRLAEDHKEVARTCFLAEFITHGKIKVHTSRENGDVPIEFCSYADVWVESKSTRNKQIEAHPAHSFFGGFLDL
jgi:hypothetical protein